MPSWIPEGWEQVAFEALFSGNRKFIPEANRLFNLREDRFKEFWKAADKAWSKRSRAHQAIPLEYFRHQILMMLCVKGGKIPASIAAINSERKKIAAQLKKVRFLLRNEPDVARIRVTDLFRFASDIDAEQDNPNFGRLQDTMRFLEYRAGVMHMLSPTLTEMLLALENRLNKGMQLSVTDPLVMRNNFAVQGGRANAQQKLLELALQACFEEATGKSHNRLVAIGVEMAMKLPAGSISADAIRARLRKTSA